MDQLPVPVLKKASEKEDYQPLDLFDWTSGEVHWLHRVEGKVYVGIYRCSEEIPDFVTYLTTDDYLWCLEGEIRVDFVGGPTVSVTPGDCAFLPSGSRFRVELVKAPYKQFFVLTPPSSSFPEVPVFPTVPRDH